MDWIWTAKLSNPAHNGIPKQKSNNNVNIIIIQVLENITVYLDKDAKFPQAYLLFIQVGKFLWL